MPRAGVEPLLTLLLGHAPGVGVPHACCHANPVYPPIGTA